MEQKLRVPTADKTLQVLEIIRQQSSTSIQSLLSQIDISRSSLYALLHTLKTIGYIEQRGIRGNYQPGPRLVSWSHTSPVEPQDLLTAFYQEIATLPLDETTALIRLAHGELITLAQIESSQTVRVVLDSGQKVPAGLSSLAAILDYSSTKSVPADGFLLSDAGGILAIGLPVCRDGIHPDAALVLCAPCSRHTGDDLLTILPELREMAARLSYRLGAQVYSPYHENTPRPLPFTQVLSKSDIDDFLQRPWAARLACVRPDGTPHVVPVWHQWDGESLYLLAWPDSHWASYLSANPSVSITIDEPWSPHRRVSIRGKARQLREEELPQAKKEFMEQFFLHYLRHSIPPESPAWQADPFQVKPVTISGWIGLQTGTPDGD
ncbi:MAG: pyridoxamine 5'-phosphate oxidase family protein [Anaerolineales bacterium]|nr:pyridoxamine 5'-phosphate oxidase family protein [Anaerolineales bacterium]